jgi:uncharacterized Tic20 family protein
VTEPGSAAPPGWYRDHTGYPRWWDGTQWGPYAPPPPPRDSSHTLAVICHLGSVAGGFILPLAIYLSEGNKNSFVRHHAREALNFQLTTLIAYLGGFLLFFGSFFLSAASDSSFPGFFFPFSLFSMIWFVPVGFSVMGAVRASQNQWWRYPVAIRFLKDEIAG